MNRNPLFYMVRAFAPLALLVLMWLWSALSGAQEITRVLPESDNTGVLILVAGLALAGGAGFVRFKRPELWAKLTRQASGAQAALEKLKANAYSGLHHFEALEAPKQPAITITPTHPVLQEIAAQNIAINNELHDNLSVALAPAPDAPKFINGRMVG